MFVKLVVSQVDLLELFVDGETSEYDDYAFVPQVVATQVQLLKVACRVRV